MPPGLIAEKYDFSITYEATGSIDKAYRPDVVLKLPEEKSIVIDAKVSLLHYKNSLIPLIQQKRNKI